MVRYVNDLVILVETEREAQDAYSLAQSQIAALGLSIHELNVHDSEGRIKTRIVGPSGSFDFLGVTISDQQIVLKVSKWEDLRFRINEVTSADDNKRSLVEVITKINALVRGWFNSYSFCDIPRSKFEKIDRVVRDRIGGWLAQRGICKDRNVVSLPVARSLGVASATTFAIDPIYSSNPDQNGSPHSVRV